MWKTWAARQWPAYMLRGMEAVCCRVLAAGKPPGDPGVSPEGLGGLWAMLLRLDSDLGPPKLGLGVCCPLPPSSEMSGPCSRLRRSGHAYTEP